MKMALHDEIEKILNNQVAPQGFDNDQVRVADLFFSYDNSAMIHALRARGLAIKNNNWAGLEKINA